MSRGRAEFEGRVPSELFVVAIKKQGWKKDMEPYWTHRIYSRKQDAQSTYNREVKDSSSRHKSYDYGALEIQMLRLGVAQSDYELLDSWSK